MNQAVSYRPNGTSHKSTAQSAGWGRKKRFRVLKGRFIVGTVVGIANNFHMNAGKPYEPSLQDGYAILSPNPAQRAGLL